MRKIKNLFGLSLIAVMTLALAGCLIISGTFVIVYDFDLTAETGFYYYPVDITEEEDWEDNKDKIDFIDVVGFEFTIENDNSVDVTFNVYVDEFGTGGGSVPATASIIIDGLTVPPGTTKFTYAQSLAVLKNVDRLKALVKSGTFDYYGTATGNEGANFRISTSKVIVTVSAS